MRFGRWRGLLLLLLWLRWRLQGIQAGESSWRPHSYWQRRSLENTLNALLHTDNERLRRNQWCAYLERISMVICKVVSFGHFASISSISSQKWAWRVDSWKLNSISYWYRFPTASSGTRKVDESGSDFKKQWKPWRREERQDTIIALHL